MNKKIVQPIIVGLLCLLAGLAFGRGVGEDQNVLGRKATTVNSIPKEYGRLVSVDRSAEGPVLYFEAEDGTIRIVIADYGTNYGSLRFRAITVPRQ
jgi:hypothetical protein